ncbi:MAG: UDP-N-acetylmuramyl-tripeptide synthetase, partial [candidate division Zixibacteria bacterium]|nr:UDP-N-acetylmuramyl-tripeptide synthetase [candidate division Zixibacteria bacterium]
MKLGELIAEIDGAKLDGNADVEISRIEYDSRHIDEGCLFVAIKGFQSDGYDFVKDALDRGAVAVLGARSDCDGVKNHVSVDNDRKALADVAAKFYGYPGMNIKACGVTGTNGKTTTCHLIRNILQARMKTTGLVTSAVYSTGKDSIDAERTTPESLDLQALLFQMKRNHCVNAVIEVSSHALALHRVDNIDFRVAVYTNLTRDHLDFHKTFEEYAETKAQLARRLDGPLCYAVVNLDVPEFRQLIGDITSSHIGYSLDNEEADVYCSNYKLKPDGTIFDLVTPMGTHTITFPLPGSFNLMNALAGAAGGLASGIDLDNVVRGLEKSVPIPG